jgi:hypothetical protein
MMKRLKDIMIEILNPYDLETLFEPTNPFLS